MRQTAKEKQRFLGKKPKSSRSIEFEAAPEFDERALPTSVKYILS